MASSNEEQFHRVTDILRCKWTIAIIDGIASGNDRPSSLERSLDGLTTKVLNERIKKLERYGVLVKCSFEEHPPRTVYRFTERGEELVKLITEIRTFALSW